MQELVYSLSYVLEHMDLLRNWVYRHRRSEGKCMRNCAVRTVKVWITFVELPSLFRAPCIIFRSLQNNLGKDFEHFKSAM